MSYLSENLKRLRLKQMFLQDKTHGWEVRTVFNLVNSNGEEVIRTKHTENGAFLATVPFEMSAEVLREPLTEGKRSLTDFWVGLFPEEEIP